MYGRARLLVNTSEVEGFPNAYLQSWIRGVPVVSYVDPDGVIGRNGLGAVVESPLQMRDAILRLLRDPSELASVSSRCRAFMAREYAEDRILTPYLTAFEELTHASVPHTLATSARRHV